MAYSATLLSSGPARSGLRVIYSIFDGVSATYGPFVDERPLGEVVATYIAAVAAAFPTLLANAEIASNVSDVTTNGSLATPSLKFSVAADNFSALRVAYATATQIQAVMIGDFLNTLTNAQLAAAFNITTTQAQTLRTNKLQPAATLATSIRASIGQ